MTVREPDLIVYSEASAAAILQDGKLLRIDRPAPTLVVEVVSSSDKDKRSRDLDYLDKRREYGQRGIPEYWIIDLIAQVILILTLVGQEYQEQRFVGDEHLVSPALSQLDLRATQVLTAGL